MAGLAAGLATVEQMVGMITDAVKAPDVPAADVVAEVRGFHEALGQELPAWCTEEFVDAVRERMRRLLGHWKATPYRQTMEIGWPEPASSPMRR
jgi:hypothetical protein